MHVVVQTWIGDVTVCDCVYLEYKVDSMRLDI